MRPHDLPVTPHLRGFTAAGSIVAALAITFALVRFLAPTLGPTVSPFLYLLPVMFAAWAGGWSAALAVALAGAVLASAPTGPLALFGALALAVAALTWGLRQTRQRTDDAVLATRTALENIDEAIVGIDVDGTVRFLNHAAQELTGWPQEEAAGKPFETVVQLVDEKTRQSMGSPVRRAAPIESFDSIEPLALIGRHGTEVSVDGVARPVLDNDNHVIGAVVVLRDMSAHRQAEARSRHLAAIVDSSTDAIVAKDLNGVVTSWNDGAARLFGYVAAEMVGRPIAILMPEGSQDEEATILDRIRRDEKVDHFETIRQRKDGRLVPVSLAVSPIHDAAGRVVGASNITRDITERRRLQAQLQDRITELAEFNRRKDEFLATLAHELRNPLAPIGSAVQIMKLAGRDREMLENARQIVERQHQQLTRLVDDLLDVARITRGRIELQKQCTELARIIANAVESVKPFAQSRGHEIRVQLPDEPLWLTVDPVRIAQVFTNLLDNAVKYTPTAGVIRLSVTRREGDAIVEVQDDGIGMPPSVLRSLFDSIGPGVAHMPGRRGLGIGLILVKAIVGMHGGTVEAHSAGPARGSRFSVRLPLDVISKPPRPASPEHQETLSARRVLVVDDNNDVVDTLSTLLRLLGHAVAVAHDGQEALVRAREFDPQVVLLDVGLPGMDGYETARLFRADPKLKSSLLVAVTGWGRDEDRLRTRNAGFDYHLTKPATMDDLVHVLQETHSEN